MRMFLAACVGIVMLAACNQNNEPEIDVVRVTNNRQAINACDADGWRQCRGGFVQYDDGRLLVIKLDGALTPAAGTLGPDEITSGMLTARLNQEQFLNSVTLILPVDEGAWSQAAIAHARQRTEPRVVTEPPQTASQ